jgi:tRNA1Val (adenine37-N6)-methyltransferase
MDIFNFKQFDVDQTGAAHKVGTDGVLLGSWSEALGQPMTALDIGAGTGLIAMMLAQRFPNAEIDAIEASSPAYELSVKNFENSPWAVRLFCYHATLTEFTEELDDEYDLITCNPPFYNGMPTDATIPTDRDLARYAHFMPLTEVLACSQKLLAENGVLNLILPVGQKAQVKQLAHTLELCIADQMVVQGREGSPPIRICLRLVHQNSCAFAKAKLNSPDSIILEKERHVLTTAYAALTKEFYL